MYLTVVFLPFIAFFSLFFFGKKIGKHGSQIISLLCLFVSFLLSLYIFKKVALENNVVIVDTFYWIDFYMYNVKWSFYFDTLTSIMLIVVTFISFLVHFYSVEYMKEDPHVIRFFSYLSLFTFFMLMLITGGNLLQMFVGWEGVGLSSYLLINFWFTRIQANKSAMKAMIVNRIGDLGLSLGIVTCFYLYQSVDFPYIFAATELALWEEGLVFWFDYEIDLLNAVGFFILIGAIGKSAQLGLHTWLPDAMEGPTPVSALIHAATMVTAGVFVLIRCSIIFEHLPYVLTVTTIIGGLTAFFAATTGVVQNDLKKVIAYSTCSQLGYMIFACGISNYSASMFHLTNHAFFKALLFLSAGSVIHAMCDEQDMRKMGGLYQYLPFTYIMMIIGSLSLMGFPFLTGFYSKDLILELTYSSYLIEGIFVYWLGVISAFFTAFYSLRLIYMTFLTSANFPRKYLYSIHEAPFFMMIPLILLCFGSIFIGYITKDMMVGMGSDFFGSSIQLRTDNLHIIEAEFLPFHIKIIPLIFTFIGAILPFLLYSFNIKFYFHEFYFLRKLYKFLNQKWYFDTIYNKFIVSYVLQSSYHVTFKIIDRGIIEIIGPLSIVTKITDITNSMLNYFKKHKINFITFGSISIILPIILFIAFFVEFESLILVKSITRIFKLYIF